MNTHLKSLLCTLSDGQLHSGAELATKLNMTRQGVWKLLRELEELNIVLEAKSRVGYRIPGGLDLLEQTQILGHLSSHLQIQPDQLYVFDSIDSTNSWLKQQTSLQEKPQMLWCLAEQQTAGRGRMGRQWCSPFGCNLYLSGLWYFQKNISALAGLSLVLAIAAVQALKACGITDEIFLKWPNDIYCKGAKLAGILVEISGEFYHQNAVIMGIGLNINMPEIYREPISKNWINLSSLKSEKKISRNFLAAEIIHHWSQALKLFEQKDFSVFQEQFRQLDLSLNQPVEIVFPSQSSIQGISESIDEQGNFQIRDAQQQLRKFACGEVSLKI